jgi:hypothetical protein
MKMTDDPGDDREPGTAVAADQLKPTFRMK